MSAAPAIGRMAWSTTNLDQTRTVVDTPQELRPEDDMFVLECRFGTWTFGRMTGRTRKFYGMDCPTIERFEVDTVVIDGAIWGTPGASIPGTFAIHPRAIGEEASS